MISDNTSDMSLEESEWGETMSLWDNMNRNSDDFGQNNSSCGGNVKPRRSKMNVNRMSNGNECKVKMNFSRNRIRARSVKKFISAITPMGSDPGSMGRADTELNDDLQIGSMAGSAIRSASLSKIWRTIKGSSNSKYH